MVLYTRRSLGGYFFIHERVALGLGTASGRQGVFPLSDCEIERKGPREDPRWLSTRFGATGKQQPVFQF